MPSATTLFIIAISIIAICYLISIFASSDKRRKEREDEDDIFHETWEK